jgi:hypothetical protein
MFGITVTHRDFTEVILCSFCKITVSQRDSDIPTAIPNAHLIMFFIGIFTFMNEWWCVLCIIFSFVLDEVANTTKYMFGITVDMSESHWSTINFQKLHSVAFIKSRWFWHTHHDTKHRLKLTHELQLQSPGFEPGWRCSTW